MSLDFTKIQKFIFCKIDYRILHVMDGFPKKKNSSVTNIFAVISIEGERKRDAENNIRYILDLTYF